LTAEYRPFVTQITLDVKFLEVNLLKHYLKQRILTVEKTTKWQQKLNFMGGGKSFDPDSYRDSSIKKHQQAA